MRNHSPSATCAELVDDDHNMLVQARYPQQQREFVDYLQQDLCSVEHLEAWIGGSFNVLIPVVVNNSYRVAVRCPWPHHTQSLTSPNMADEKIRGEAAAYVWMSKYCPSVPIPQLIGFGLSNGRSFTPVMRCSWIRRAFESIREIPELDVPSTLVQIHTQRNVMTPRVRSFLLHLMRINDLLTEVRGPLSCEIERARVNTHTSILNHINADLHTYFLTEGYQDVGKEVRIPLVPDQIWYLIDEKLQILEQRRMEIPLIQIIRYDGDDGFCTVHRHSTRFVFFWKIESVEIDPESC
ncbi:hypothetical protein E4T43_03810 [Aureobasidium subglaciale]|nr:hypothetical protein E4T43_03810 [Aureobasidium subglaciale]